MKAFYISLILFILLISVIAVNSIYVGKVVEKTISLAESISGGQDMDKVRELEAYWEGQKKIMSLGVSYRELDRVSETLIGLRSSLETGNVSDTSLYRALLIEAAEELKK